jgi:predicted DNA-binding ribbon-helix-helix protein
MALLDKEQPSMPKRVKDPRRESLVIKRSVKVSGLQTSVALEDAFWIALKNIAAAQGTSVRHLIATIDNERRKGHHSNLSSAIRLFVLDCYRSRMRP